MAKIFYVVRHAKSSWKDFSLRDHQRPLNNRGKRDAPIMARQIVKSEDIPSLLVSSDANRAYSTAQYFADLLLGDKNAITKAPALYHGSEDDFVSAVQEQDDAHDCIMLFGHNPGITYLANAVSQKNIDNVPTCGVLKIRSHADTWAKVELSNSELIDFIYPKMFV